MADSIRQRHGGRPLVFALGRMAAYKGFETLIEAAGRMRHDAHVIVGGSGELLDEHRRNVRMSKLGHRIRFAGEMSDDEVRAHMAAADVFCLPSRSRAEAFGMVLHHEANLAASLPIVASDIPGSGVSWVNVEGETGYNVRMADSDALAGAIDALLEDPTRARRMGLAGRSRLDAVFNEQRMIDETLAVYRGTGLQVLDGRGSRSGPRRSQARRQDSFAGSPAGAGSRRESIHFGDRKVTIRQYRSR